MGKIAVSTLFGAVGAFAAILFSVILGYIFIDLSFLSDASCGGQDEYVFCFFDEGWDSGTYLSTITGFYSTIITILITLIGAVAAFAYITIRGTALQRAEETIGKEVVMFFKTDEGGMKIRQGLETTLDIDLEKFKLRLDVIELALEEAEIPFEQLRLDDAEETEKAD